MYLCFLTATVAILKGICTEANFKSLGSTHARFPLIFSVNVYAKTQMICNRNSNTYMRV